MKRFRSTHLPGQVATSLYAGAIGQAFAFLSFLVPIFFRQEDVLPGLVFVGAIATIFAPMTIFMSNLTLPLETSEKIKDSLSQALTFLLIITSTVGLSSYLPLFNLVVSEYLAASGVLVLGMGVYLLVQALMIRAAEKRLLSIHRLLCSLLLFGSTCIAGLMDGGLLGYSLASSISFLAPSLALLFSSKNLRHFLRLGFPSVSKAMDTVRVNRHLYLSHFVSSFTGQTLALLTPLAGPTATLWALAVRVSSGFETLGGQIVGPQLDTDISRAIREKNVRLFEDKVKAGLRLGLLLFSGASIFSTLSLLILVPSNTNPSIQVASFVLVAISASIQVFFSTNSRVFFFASQIKLRMSLDVLKSGLLALTLLLGSGPFRDTAILLILFFHAIVWASSLWSLRRLIDLVYRNDQKDLGLNLFYPLLATISHALSSILTYVASIFYLRIRKGNPRHATLFSKLADDENLLCLIAALGKSLVQRITVLTPNAHETKLLAEARKVDVRTVLFRDTPHSKFSVLRILSKSGILLASYVPFFAARPNRHRKFVYLTHGAGPKRTVERGQMFNAIVMDADVWAEETMKNTGLSKSAEKHKGLPRLDTLRASEDNLAHNVRSLNLVVWAPTYRQTTDYVDSSTERIEGAAWASTLADYKSIIKYLSDQLESKGFRLCVKPHPLERFDFTAFDLQVISQKDLDDWGLTNYQFLALTRGLITDYSSIWVDYIRTGNPVGFFIPDMQNFSVSRGLLEGDYDSIIHPLLIQDQFSANRFVDFLTNQKEWKIEETKLRSAIQLSQDRESHTLHLIRQMGLAGRV